MGKRKDRKRTAIVLSICAVMAAVMSLGDVRLRPQTRAGPGQTREMGVEDKTEQRTAQQQGRKNGIRRHKIRTHGIRKPPRPMSIT